MKAVATPRYAVDIGDHAFPTRKFHLTAAKLVADAALSAADIVEPPPFDRADLLLVHDADFVDRALSGELSLEEETVLELPCSPEVAAAHALAVSGTVLAARLAIEGGLGLHAGGGAHHAFPGHGEGFCLFNDIAVAVRKLRADGKARRATVVDLDVHQGNGTAACFAADPEVFTFSMHQEALYPFPKVPGSLDVGLEAGTGDAKYLNILRENLPRALDGPRPEFVVYQAGVDCHESDLLGGMKLTTQGLAARDRAVFEACRRRGLPVVVTLGGGYSAKLEDTVALHAQTLRIALETFRG